MKRFILFVIITLLVSSYWFGHITGVKANQTWREFASIEELQEWASRQTIILYPNKDGVVNLIVLDAHNSCSHQAERMQRQALSEGYLVSMAPVTRGYVLDTLVSEPVGHHVGIWTTIGNDYYYIDSFTHKVVRLNVRRN